MEQNIVFLLLGSNLGNSIGHLSDAIRSIIKSGNILLQTSSVYKTAPWGNTNQPDFHNQAVKISTPLSAEKLMNDLLEIEKDAGRIRLEKYGPRIIDIDILFFNREIHNSEFLTIPHPRIAERRFVLVPMHEIAPDFIHPVFNKTIRELLFMCPDNTLVEPLYTSLS